MPVAIAAFIAALYFILRPSSSAKPATPAQPAGALLRVPSPSRAAFVADLRAAMSNVDMRQIPMDLALVKFDLETGTGRGDIFIHTNNPGSIKSFVGWTGKPSYKETRVYPTLEDGIRDWVRLISESKGPRPQRPDYSKAYEAMKRRDFKGAFLELERAGYEVSLDPPYNVRLASRLAAMQKEGWV